MFIEVTSATDGSKCMTNLRYIEDILSPDDKEKENGVGCVIRYAGDTVAERDVKESYDEVKEMISRAHLLTLTKQTITPASPPTVIRKTVDVDSGCLLLGDACVLEEMGLCLGGISDSGAACENVHDINPMSVNEEMTTFIEIRIAGRPGYLAGTLFPVPLPSGKLFLGDPCHYVEKDAWDAFIRDTDLGRKLPQGIHYISTGGDGSFDITLAAQETLQRQSRA